MAKLYFSYAAMNAGKSTILLQASYNYRERGMKTLLMTAQIDNRAGTGKVASRTGLVDVAEMFNADTDIAGLVQQYLQVEAGLDCILVDEAQFLSESQVWQLAQIADQMRIPVLCYGLRTDFQGKLFPGSKALLAIADELREIRTICWCGSKATMVLRLDGEGNPVEVGEQVQIGGNETYISLCRKHWSARQSKRETN